MRDDYKVTWEVEDKRIATAKVEELVWGGNLATVLTLQIKYDGCMDMWMEHEHWCGPGDFLKFVALIKALYEEGFKRMGQEPEELWPETSDAESIYEVVETVFTESSPAQASQLDQGQRS